MERIGTDLASKAALVTGGATDIGRAIATHFAGQAMRVSTADLDRAAAQGAASAIGGDAVDVTRRDSVTAALAEVERQVGTIDRVVANAGVSSMKSALDLTDEDWDFNFEVNSRGAFLTNQAACRHFLEHGFSGAICNAASLAAKVGAPLLAHYSASKFAVVGWAQAMAMAQHGIRGNAVCPGFVRTGMQSREVIWEAELRGITPEAVLQDYIGQTPLSRIEEPEDVTVVVAFSSMQRVS